MHYRRTGGIDLSFICGAPHSATSDLTPTSNSSHDWWKVQKTSRMPESDIDSPNGTKIALWWKHDLVKDLRVDCRRCNRVRSVSSWAHQKHSALSCLAFRYTEEARKGISLI